LVECDQDLLHHLACSDISLIRRKQKASLGCQPAVRRDVMEPLLLTSEMNAPLLRFVFAQSEYRSKTWTTKPSSLSSRTCPTDHTKAFGAEDDFAFSAFGSSAWVLTWSVLDRSRTLASHPCRRELGLAIPRTRGYIHG
jgi:hypothetical protein